MSKRDFLAEIAALERAVDEVSIGWYQKFNEDLISRLRAAEANTISADERRMFSLAAEALPSILMRALEPLVRELEESRRLELALMRTIARIRNAAADGGMEPEARSNTNGR